MTNYNLGKIVARAVYLNKDTKIGRNTYRYVENSNVIYRCPTKQVGMEWKDNEGNKFNGWQLHYEFISASEILDAMDEYLDTIGGML